MVTRGELWEYVIGSQQYRALIISNDEYNEHPDMRPWGLIVSRLKAAPGDAAPLFVSLGPGDPGEAGAVVQIPAIVRLDRTALRHNLGFVTNATLNAVERGLREFLALP